MLAPMPLRLAMLTPFGPPAARGNAVTVARIARGLGERGVELRVWDLSTVSPATIESEVEAYRPALIHGFHAHRVGPLALRLAQRVSAPLVVTLTGTDANHDLFDGEWTSFPRRCGYPWPIRSTCGIAGPSRRGPSSSSFPSA